MSELQAIFQARRRRQASAAVGGGGADPPPGGPPAGDADHDAASASGVGYAGSDAAVVQSANNHNRWASASGPGHDAVERPDGIEVSPTPGQREALRLDEGGAGPPPMAAARDPTGGGRADLTVDVNAGADAGTDAAPSPSPSPKNELQRAFRDRRRGRKPGAGVGGARQGTNAHAQRQVRPGQAPEPAQAPRPNAKPASPVKPPPSSPRPGFFSRTGPAGGRSTVSYGAVGANKPAASPSSASVDAVLPDDHPFAGPLEKLRRERASAGLPGVPASAVPASPRVVGGRSSDLSRTVAGRAHGRAQQPSRGGAGPGPRPGGGMLGAMAANYRAMSRAGDDEGKDDGGKEEEEGREESTMDRIRRSKAESLAPAAPTTDAARGGQRPRPSSSARGGGHASAGLGWNQFLPKGGGSRPSRHPTDESALGRLARHPTDEIADDVAESDAATASASRNGTAEARRREVGGGSMLSVGGTSAGTSEAAPSPSRDPEARRRRVEVGASVSPRPVHGSPRAVPASPLRTGAGMKSPASPARVPPSPSGAAPSPSRSSSGGQEKVPEFMRVALRKRDAGPAEPSPFAARAAMFEARSRGTATPKGGPASSPRTVPSPSSLSRVPRGSIGSRGSVGSRGSIGSAAGSPPAAPETGGGGRTGLVSESPWHERARGAAPLVPSAASTPPRTAGRKTYEPPAEREPVQDQQKRQRQSPSRGATYDTAVEAARDAIRTSNRGRVVVGNGGIDGELQERLRGRQARSDGPVVPPGEAGADDEDDDPGLTAMDASPGPSPGSSVVDDAAVVAGSRSSPSPHIGRDDFAGVGGEHVAGGYAEEDGEEYSYAEDEYGGEDASDGEDEEYHGKAGSAETHAVGPREAGRDGDGFDGLLPRASDGPIDYFATYDEDGGAAAGGDDIAFDAFGPSFADDAGFPPQPQGQEGDPFGSSDPFDPFSTAAFSHQDGPAQAEPQSGGAHAGADGVNALATVTASEEEAADDVPSFAADFGDTDPPPPPSPDTPKSSGPGTPRSSGGMSDVCVSRSSSEEGSEAGGRRHHRRLSSEFKVDANLLSPLEDQGDGDGGPDEFGVDADLLSPTLSGESVVYADLLPPSASGESSEGRLRVDTDPPLPLQGGSGPGKPEPAAATRPMISPSSRPAGPTRSAAVPGTFDEGPAVVSLLEDPRDASRVPAPTPNPVTGNLIAVRCDARGRLSVAEVVPPDGGGGAPPAVASSPVLTDELRALVVRSTGRRVAGVRSVSSLAAGTHRTRKGGRRVRVAAVADLVVAGGRGGTSTEPFALVWRWDRGGDGTASLQSALSLSAISSGLFRHDATTLRVADGLVLLGGSSGTNPCVFAAKPAVRDGWLPVEIRNTRARSVTCLAASDGGGRRLLAVGMNDGTVRVASYDAAVRTNRIGTDSSHLSEGDGGGLLRTVCRIRGIMDVDGLDDADCLWPDERLVFSLVDGDGTGGAASSPRDARLIDDEARLCTSLSWVRRGPSGVTGLPLLAACYAGGVAVYRVPAGAAAAAASSFLPPLAAAKFMSSTERSELFGCLGRTRVPLPRGSVEWAGAGPRSPPFLVLSLSCERRAHVRDGLAPAGRVDTSRVCLLAVDLPWHGGPGAAAGGGRPRPIGVVCQGPAGGAPDGSGGAVLVAGPSSSIMRYDGLGRLSALLPTALPPAAAGSRLPGPRGEDDFFASLSRPVSSAALGLDSEGAVHFGDLTSPAVRNDYRDSVLSVFTVTTCAGPEGGAAAPSQRHWLLISSPGDTAADVKPSPPSGDAAGAVLTTSATTDVLFELTCAENPAAGLVPGRVVREDSGRRVAVLFAPGFFGGGRGAGGDGPEVRTRTDVRRDPVAYAIMDLDEGINRHESAPFKLHQGRDAAFLPPCLMDQGFYCSTLLVVDADGMSLSAATAISSDVLPGGKDGRTVVESVQRCCLEHEGIVGRRIFTLMNDGHPEILLGGYSPTVERPCLLLSKHRLERDPSTNQFTLIEEAGLGHRVWLRPNEEVLNVQELPLQANATRANVAVASSERVMILSAQDSLSILSEINVKLSCPSLSALGSHTVAFGVSSSVMYLSCLGGRHGVIANLSAPEGRFPSNILLAALRPDRCVYFTSQSDLRVVGPDEEENSFAAPIAKSKPIFLLEPLVANALCLGDSDIVQATLRTVIERFGRMDPTFAHGGGIGSFGIGITSDVYQMLVDHDCHEAASYLLTGSTPANGAAQPDLIPSWIPMREKLIACNDIETSLQVLSNGDLELAKAVRGQDFAGSTNLPAPGDPSCELAVDLAAKAVRDGSLQDAIRLLDFASSDQSLLDLVSSLRTRAPSAFEPILRELVKNRTDKEGIQDYEEALVRASLDAESLNVSHLAPSVHTPHAGERARRSLINKQVVESAVPKQTSSQNGNAIWAQTIKADAHLWSTGPFNQKENILELNSIDDWLGRGRLNVLGKEGVENAADTGERALAKILSAAKREEAFVPESNVDAATSGGSQGKMEKWVPGIGEGRHDEDNVSLYLRFSEGDDEDCGWRTDGFTDLTKFAHHARLHGVGRSSLEATSSSVDEGEAGKVQLLYDLVFDEGAPRTEATGVVVEVPRGSSLDLGMLHSPHHSPRQKCTLELWYHLPQSHLVTDEIILARRSLFYEEDDDATKLCLPDERHNTLWELAVLPTGLLELRTGAGSVINSAVNIRQGDEGACGLVSWERDDGGGGWNHVALVFDSSASDSLLTDCTASIMMNAEIVVPPSPIAVNPFGDEADLNEDDIDDAMQKSVLIFASGPSPGFRVTDIRVWACRREAEDIKMMMFECLREAEMKKKFKVNIRKEGSKKTAKGVLAPPKRLPLPEAKKKITLDPPRQKEKVIVQPDTPDAPSTTSFQIDADFAAFDSVNDAVNDGTDVEAKIDDRNPISDENDSPNTAPPNQDTLAIKQLVEEEEIQSTPESSAFDVSPSGMEPVDEATEDIQATPPSFEVSFSNLLSTKVRRSAASALIRGPPAARHFGGNRGGLVQDERFYGAKPNGVSPIAISGAEKSVVLYAETEPVGKTYPIGASGAVLSDIMDKDGSEFMSCFLAKEKRMVVFELSKKTVVVELSMKTKLNFWRYLPPSSEGDLIFVLITPIGGFHWRPLDELPRPVQVWKRGPELESKKILTYEEGGSNGHAGADAMSSVALVMTSSPSSGSLVEAYCIALNGGSKLLCLSTVALGGALMVPPNVSKLDPFLPYVVSVNMDVMSKLVLDVEQLNNKPSEGLVRGEIVSSTVLDIGDSLDEKFDPPPLSMGATPEVLCCTLTDFIVAVVRREGTVFAFNFSSDTGLVPVGKSRLGQYIVDATLRSGSEDGVVEVVLLLCENEDSKDGRIATITLRANGDDGYQYLSSI